MANVLTWGDFAGVALTFTLAAIAAPGVARVMATIGWVDRPDERKRHGAPVPLGGGALVIGSMALVATLLPHLEFARGFWIGGLVLFVVGFIDDRVPIRARYRFLAQIAACGAAIAWEGGLLRDLGRSFGHVVVPLSVLAVPATLVCMCGLVNAVNMTDGMDGLAGGYTFVSLLWLAAVTLAASGDSAAASATAYRQVIEIAITMAAVLGFLVWNMRSPFRRRAALFLGDAGSTFLGFVIAWFALRLVDSHGPFQIPPVVVLALVGLPVVDVASCIVRRIFIEHRTPMSPDCRHMHHMLLSFGMPAQSAATVLICVQFAVGGLAFALWRLGVPEHVMVLAFGAGFALYLRWYLSVWVRADAREPVVAVADDIAPEVVAAVAQRHRG